MATHFSILAWEIPWTEEPGRLQSRGVTRVTHDLATKQPPRSTSVKWEKCVFQNNNSDGYQEKMV